MPIATPSFLDDCGLSLLLFGGKGGVGKTTCATATALRLAERFPDRTFLLASSDPAHSLSDSLAGACLPTNLQCREIDFRQSLERFRNAHRQQFCDIAMRGTFLDEEDISRFVDLSAPGFDELMAFLDLAALLRDRSYGCMVIDTAPTGHTLRFLELPELMRTWLVAFDAMLGKHRYLTRLYGGSEQKDGTDLFLEDIEESIRQLGSLLTDPVHCRFIPVMLAEAMSTMETQRLVTRLQQLKIPVKDILVNRLYPERSTCPVCLDSRRCQQRELDIAAARFADVSLWTIPRHGGEVRGALGLKHLWDGLDLFRPASCNVTEPIHLPPQVESAIPLPGPAVRLLLFAGKGGVGKTTLACASALRLARQYPEKKVLLFSTDPAHSLSDCVELVIGPIEVCLASGLRAIEIDAAAEFESLKQRYLEEVEEFFDSLLGQAGADLAFDHDVVQSIVDLSPPGLDEVMALLRVMTLIEEKQYDLFVLDTAPTGHLIRLLETPELIDHWLKAVFQLFLKYQNVFRLPHMVDYLVGLSKQLKQLRRLLADPEGAQLLAVSIPTEMALEETCDLIGASRRAGVRVPAIFLNLATPPTSCPLCEEVAAAEIAVRRRFAERFSEVPQAIVYRCSEPRGLDRLTELGQALFGPCC